MSDEHLQKSGNENKGAHLIKKHLSIMHDAY